MPPLSNKELASIQTAFASTALRDSCVISRRSSSGTQGALQDGGFATVGTATYACYMTARIRQPDPDPDRRSYANPSQVNTEDERHIWIEAACPVKVKDRITLASTGQVYTVTNLVNDYTPMPGVICAVQRLKS